MIDPNYPSLSRAIVASVLWRVLAAGAGLLATAWPSSRTARLFTAGRGVSTKGVARVAVAAAAIALTVQFAIPTYVRSGLPFFWPLSALALLGVVAAWPAPFERAWPQSTLARTLAGRKAIGD